MGGLYGRIPYLYEQVNFSLDKLERQFNALQNATPGVYVHEKPDGQNVLFSFDKHGNLVFARNKTDLKNGGFKEKEVKERWKKKPLIRDAYVFAYAAIDDWSRTRISIENRRYIHNFNLWHSAEVLYAKNPNVIEYGVDAIVLHDDEFKVRTTPKKRLPELINSKRDRKVGFGVDACYDEPGYRFYTPQTFMAPKCINAPYFVCDPESYQKQSSLWIQIYSRKIRQLTASLRMKKGESVIRAVREAYFDHDKNLRTIKWSPASILTPQEKTVFLNPHMKQWVMAEVSNEVNNYVYELFDGERSKFLKDHKQHEIAISNINARIDEAVKNKHKLDKKKQERLEYELSQLREVNTAIEGVTIQYDGSKSKLTGNFAHINQILGLSRY